jgi:hypothetical protein
MTRSAWTHAICDACWALRNGDRDPFRVIDDPADEKCCQCGKACRGIFVREDPSKMHCNGVHREVKA